jgi:hypothetical protein
LKWHRRFRHFSGDSFMDQIRFAHLPFLTKFSSVLTLFLSWVAFAELIIDRHHLDHFLPFYRVGNLCPYDLVVIAALVGVWFMLHRQS